MNIKFRPVTKASRYGLLTLTVILLFYASVTSATLTGCSAGGKLSVTTGSPAPAGSTASASFPAPAGSPASAPADLMINYRISMDDAVNHNFRVTMTIDGVSADTLVLKMPVWTPGYYWI